MEISNELLATKRRVEADLLSRPGVTGVDIGFKEVGGQLTDQLSIRVHVAQKKARVSAAERVPAEIDGVVTDVLERQYELQVVSQALDISAQADTTHYATLQGGISMGPSRVIGGSVYAGTLGAIVIDNASNQHAAITNFHVACVDSGWSVGDRMCQPSRIDTGNPPADEFGAIVRATLSSNVDGAVISIDPGHANACTIAQIGNVKGTKTATLGMAVRKRGRTTGLTYGTVDGLNLTVQIDYGDGIGNRTLVNQVSIKSDTAKNPLFSDHGDSGSVIVDDGGYVVGLLFGGAGTGTVANPIAAVLSELNVSMCVPKSLLKDIVDTKKPLKDLKDHTKDVLKDKEHLKDGVKDKEHLKDLIKDKEIKEQLKEKPELKELLRDKSPIKEIRDIDVKGIFETIPDVPGPGPIETGSSPLEQRLQSLEQQLTQLASFINASLRPDLLGGGNTTDADVAALQAALEQQAAQDAGVKAELDNLR